MKLTLNDWENLNLLSNRNLEKIVGSLVNRSSNAVLVNMFEDSLILLDHEDNQFYIADYKFDRNNFVLEISNFEPVELVREEESFKEKLMDYFEDEDISPLDLVESYKDEVLEQDRFIRELIQDAIATKDFDDVVDYGKIKEVKEDVSIANEKFFKEYQERLQTHPLTKILMFDWHNPVRVSLVETETTQTIKKGIKENAKELWKDEDFREAFEEMAKVLIEDVELGTEMLKALLESYPGILYLDAGDRKELFGKTILSIPDLNENLKLISKGLDKLFEEDEIQGFILTLTEEEDGGEEGDTGEEGGDDSEEEAKELSPEELKKLADELKKVADKIDDDKLKEKLDKVIKKLENSEEEGTSPETVKEAVAILSL